MSPESHQGFGLLASCVSIRGHEDGWVQTQVFTSVLDAVEYGIRALAGRDDRTAVVVVGEDDSVQETEDVLSMRSAGLAGALDQAGLFITLAAQDIVRDRLADEISFEDFGIIDSPEAGRAERVFAVLHPDLAEPALPYRRIAGNCPRLHKSFVGRHRERDELQSLILDRALVTIAGTAGVGKSTIAIEVARSLDEEFQDGVWWFSVDNRSSLDELLQSIASTRGLLILHGPLTIDRVAGELAGKRGIIILDGCESMAKEIGALCTAILSDQRRLSLLVTSTKPLGVAEEFVYRLDPMSLPRPSDTGEDLLIGSEALALFFERATQSGVRLALDEKNVNLSAGICERIDGLPAAIEIVAASLRTSSLEMIAAEFDIIGVTSRASSKALSGRLHSFEQVLQVNSRTLSEEELEMLSRLGLFRGEWTTEVAGFIWSDRFSADEQSRLHRSLVDSSWVSYNPERNTYRMLHTVRSFCSGKDSRLLHPFADTKEPRSVPSVFSFAVVKSRDDEVDSLARDPSSIERIFCSRMTELAAEVFAGLQGGSALEYESVLSRHYADFVYSLEICLESTGMAQIVSDLMKYMVQFWLRRNLLDDASRMSSEYLARGATDVDAARALTMLGVVHLRYRQLDLAMGEFGQCLEIARRLGMRLIEAVSLINLGHAAADLGSYDSAKLYCEQAIAIHRELGHPELLWNALPNAADVRIEQAESMPKSSETRAILLAEAAQYLEEAKAFSTQSDPFRLQSLFYNFGALALAQGELAEAEAYFSKAIALCDRHNFRHEAGEATEGLAEISLRRAQGPTAAKLLGLAREIRRESGKTRTDRETQHFGRLTSRVFQHVDADRAEKLMRYGEKLDLREILTPTIFNV